MRFFTIEDLCRTFLKITVEGDKGCWLIKGSDNGKGYMRIWLDGNQITAHQLFYELFNGDIPDGLDIHHACHQRSCVNPTHLRAIPHRLNVLLTEEYIKLRKVRLTRLIDAVEKRSPVGIARFESTELKIILGCRLDSGSGVRDVLDSIQFLYPDHFACKLTGTVPQERGRPTNEYEVRLEAPGLRAALEGEGINQESIEDILAPVFILHDIEA